MSIVLALKGGCGGATGQEKRDFSLRRPTLSQERKRKKKSACSVRNDGWRGREECRTGTLYAWERTMCILGVYTLGGEFGDGEGVQVGEQPGGAAAEGVPGEKQGSRDIAA